MSFFKNFLQPPLLVSVEKISLSSRSIKEKYLLELFELFFLNFSKKNGKKFPTMWLVLLVIGSISRNMNSAVLCFEYI